MARCPYPYPERPLFLSRPALTIALMLVGLVLFSISIFSLATHSLLYPLDQAISAHFAAVDKAMPPGLMSIISRLGDLSTAAPMLAVVYLCYRWLRKKCDDRFSLILASYGLGMLIFFLIGLAVNRPRPSLPGLLKEMPFPSFPSGHMIGTITLLAPILYIYLPRVRSRFQQIVLLIVATSYTLLVAFDRLLVNAHYLTDVLAGTGIGLFWCVAMLILYERYHVVRRAARRQMRAAGEG